MIRDNSYTNVNGRCALKTKSHGIDLLATTAPMGVAPVSAAQVVASAADHEPASDTDYWEGLINEEAAARFLGFSVRTLQGWRYRGGGPRFISISHRARRYRRRDLREWIEERVSTSTSDRGVIGS